MGRPERPLVAVFVGTDHHRFDRLLTWVSVLAAEGWADWFVQHGATPWQPAPALAVRGTAYVGPSGLDDILQRAGAVVTHGGPGMIMDAHLAGHTPIVVARDPGRREHVDDHQVRFVARLAQDGRIRAPQDLAALRHSVRTELRTAPVPRGITAVGSPDPAHAVCSRFGDLVVAARHRRRAHAR